MPLFECSESTNARWRPRIDIDIDHRPSSGCLSHVCSLLSIWLADRGQTVSVVSSAYLPPHGDTRRRAPCELEFFHLAETNNETPRRSKGHRMLACLCFRVRTFEPAYGGQPEDYSSATLSFKFKEVPLTSERRATRVRETQQFILLPSYASSSERTQSCIRHNSPVPRCARHDPPDVVASIATSRVASVDSEEPASSIIHHASWAGGPAKLQQHPTTLLEH